MADENSPKPANNIGIYPGLAEYPLQTNLSHLIPAKAQKGLSTFDVEFTCIDAEGHYIVIGSNIGIVYLFDRIRNQLNRLRNDHKDAITCVKVIISIECLVVFGSKNGAVFVFKVPLGHDEEIEKFTVEGLHSCAITALEWVKNGMKFFSADESGVVVCTEIDHFEHQSRSRVVLNEPSKVVQLSYSQKLLVVSTLFRSVIYSCEDGSITQIGEKERKCYGPFGAIIYQANNTPQGTIFASRPGQRLWKSDKSGNIQETMIFKTALFTAPNFTIPLLNGPSETNNLSDFQFEQLNMYYEKYILVSSDSSILVIDPEHKCIVASCPKLDPIISVAIFNEEIFVLRGLRHLIRISTSPDPYPCEKVPEQPSLIEEILVPFKGLSTYVKERSDSFSAQAENNAITLFGWLRKKRSTSSPAVVMGEVIQNEAPQPLPDVVKLESDECSLVVLDRSSPDQVPKIEITISGNQNDDIVYKPKKKKKKVRFRSVSPKDTHRKQMNSVSKDETDSKAFHTTDIKSPEVPITPQHDHNTKDCNATIHLEANTKSETCELSGELNDSEMMNNNKAAVTSEISKESYNSNDTGSILNNENNTSNILKPTDEVNLDSNSNTVNQEQENSNLETKYQEQNLNLGSEHCDEIDCDNKINDPYDIYLSSNSDNTSNLNTQPMEVNTEPLPKLGTQSSTSNSITSDESSSTTSTDTVEPKYGVDWLKYNTPEELLDLGVSNNHIFCVDTKNRLYYTNYPVLGLQWKLLDQPAEKIAVSQSESIVWVLYKGTIYASLHKSSIKWKEIEWASVARDVISLSVDDTCGWYVSRTGHLTVQMNLTGAQPFGYPESIRCDKTIAQVATFNSVVWVLSMSGKLYFVKKKSSSYSLEEIELNGLSDIDSIFLGVHGTGWIIDCNGIIRFLTGVSPDTPMGLGKPWEVEASQYLVRPANHLQQVVLKALNNETLTSLIRGKQHVCLSTSEQGIWFCKTMDNSIYSNQNNVIGHLWESVIPSGTASTTKWRLVSALGVLNFQGSAWCLTSAGELFCLDNSSKTLFTVDLPSISSIISLVPTTQSLWVLTEDGQIFVRLGITPNSLGGVWWQKLDLTQLGSAKIISVCCSCDVSWACTNDGQVLVRLGPLYPSSSRRLPQAWIPINIPTEEIAQPVFDKFSAIGKKFPLPLIHHIKSELIISKVCVGPLGFPVWALDKRGSAYVREGVSSSLPIGKNWTLVPELQAKELQISSSAVWILTHYGEVYRRFGISEKNPCGDYWKQIPGNFDKLSVTEDDDLWGIKDDSMFTHYSYMLNCTSKQSKKSLFHSISEDDWEDIMAEASDSET